MSFHRIFALTSLLVAGVVFAGCGKSADKAVTSSPAGTKAASDGHSHEGWWCSEHGVPEEVCALCDTTLVADFKAKGDWCDKHNRPDSQCFVCHPEKEAEFAALYEAKMGKKPPKPSDDGHDHGHDHEHEDEKKS
jgi:nitrous oxide reductase accessory protein NosL